MSVERRYFRHDRGPVSPQGPRSGAVAARALAGGAARRGGRSRRPGRRRNARRFTSWHGDAPSKEKQRGSRCYRFMGIMARKASSPAREDTWLNSGTDDQYGADSYFIATNYSDDEKQSLLNESSVKNVCKRRAMESAAARGLDRRSIARRAKVLRTSAGAG